MFKTIWSAEIAYFLRGHWSKRPVSWWDINRVILSTLLTAIAAYLVVSSGVGLWQWMVETRNAEHQYHQRAIRERQDTFKQIAQSCSIWGAPADLVGACLADELEQHGGEVALYEDLRAQQDVARWTAIMGGAAAIGIPLSALGLVAIWLSLRQTRQAISNDREIGEAQVRAYVAVEPKTPSSITSKEIVYSEFEFRNIGQSPARNVRYVAGITIAPFPLPKGQGDLFAVADGQMVPSLTLAPGPPNTGEAYAPNLFTEAQIMDAMNGGEARIYLAGSIWYRDVFQNERVTRFCFYLDEVSTPPVEVGGRQARVYNWHQSHILNDET